MPSIRRATRADGRFLAWAQLASARSHLARGFFDLILDPPDAARIGFLERMALSERVCVHHWTGFWVAEVEGRPAAALCGFDPAAPGLTPAEEVGFGVARELGWSEARIAELPRQMAPFATCHLAQAEGAWVVEFVATLPEFRRRGLADALLRAVLEEGRRRGHALAQLTILLGNAPAQRAYEKLGFKLVEARRHPDFEAAIGCPGLGRLTRDL